MKFALLGIDADVLRLAAAAIAQGHEISWVGDVPAECKAPLARFAPNLSDQGAEWELVLDRSTADAVIVGAGLQTSEVRAEQLKRIAAEAMPLLVVHPACDSVLPYYEVDMARREMGGLVRQYNPAANHPIFRNLAEWVQNGHPLIGPIFQVTWERHTADVSRDNVTRCLARDVEPLATVAGHIRRVSAIGPKIGQPSFASLQVQMTCSGAATARWSLGSSAGANADFVMTLIGQRGSIRLLGFEPGALNQLRPWKLEVVGIDEPDRQTLEPFDPADEEIRRFTGAASATSDEQRREMSTWHTATRDMEVVDATELSLEKGRTLDVHQQQFTERLAFRGTMAALGCGLLTLGFVALTFVSLFGVAEGKDRQKLISSWPIILLAVLAFFLLLQCAPLLVAKKKRNDDAENAPPPS